MTYGIFLCLENNHQLIISFFLSFYTDMEARLHFEGNFSGTLFRLKTTFFVQTLYLWKSRSKLIGHKARGLQFVGHVTKIEPTNK